MKKQLEEECRQKEEAKTREKEAKIREEEAKAREEVTKTEMAKMMLEFGKTDEDIQQKTGLDIATIKKLRLQN